MADSSALLTMFGLYFGTFFCAAAAHFGAKIEDLPIKLGIGAMEFDGQRTDIGALGTEDGCLFMTFLDAHFGAGAANGKTSEHALHVAMRGMRESCIFHRVSF